MRPSLRVPRAGALEKTNQRNTTTIFMAMVHRDMVGVRVLLAPKSKQGYAVNIPVINVTFVCGCHTQRPLSKNLD